MSENTTSSARHNRIEQVSAPDHDFELTQYRGNEVLDTIGEFNDRQKARKHHAETDSEHPLIDLLAIDLSAPLPHINPEAEGAVFNNQQINPGDVLVELSRESVRRISIVLEITQESIINFVVKGSAPNRYQHYPAEFVDKDVNSDDGITLIVIPDGYETLAESALTSPIKGEPTAQSISQHLQETVAEIKQNREKDDPINLALTDLDKYATNLNRLLNP